MKCQNELYNTDDISLPKVKCYGKASVIRHQGTRWEMHICADCANGQQRPTKRAPDALPAMRANGIGNQADSRRN